jgi:hypothetical protein
MYTIPVFHECFFSIGRSWRPGFSHICHKEWKVSKRFWQLTSYGYFPTLSDVGRSPRELVSQTLEDNSKLRKCTQIWRKQWDLLFNCLQPKSREWTWTSVERRIGQWVLCKMRKHGWKEKKCNEKLALFIEGKNKKSFFLCPVPTSVTLSNKGSIFSLFFQSFLLTP